MLHDAVVEIAHKQGGGEPAQGQKHGEDEAFHQDAHVYDERYIVPLVKEIEVERLQDMLLTPGHHRRIDKIEHSKGEYHQGHSPAEIASEVPVLEVYHKSCQLLLLFKVLDYADHEPGGGDHHGSFGGLCTYGFIAVGILESMLLKDLDNIIGLLCINERVK